jgi:hypothetical protein
VALLKEIASRPETFGHHLNIMIYKSFRFGAAKAMPIDDLGEFLSFHYQVVVPEFFALNATDGPIG